MTDHRDHGSPDYAALLEIVLQLRADYAAVCAENVALRDEIRRLKGLPPRPPMKPSGMEASSKPPSPPGKGSKRRGSSRAIVTEEHRLCFEAPAGSRFLGRTSFVVQDLTIGVRVIRYERDRWRLPDGRIMVAPLPDGIDGHFGPELRRLVLSLYHQGQSTVERIVAMLRDVGVSISKRQVVRILTSKVARFVTETRQVLQAGLACAGWISVDDTGARHKGVNGVCTQIGNDRFAVFTTTKSKSRLNFLQLLHGGTARWVLNAASRDYMLERGLAVGLTDILHAGALSGFDDGASLEAYLRSHGLEPKDGPLDAFRLASEGALWGGLVEAGTLENTVILSDGAGQFALGEHAQCWVHMERLIHTLDTFTDLQRRAKALIQNRIWWLYKDIKTWRLDPTAPRAKELARRFDSIFATKTGFLTLDRLLVRIHADRASFLKILERPDIPLHTNASENDIRSVVTRRRISAGTKSDNGRDARDAMLSMMKTCSKLGVSFWDYLGDRLGIPGVRVPPLRELLAAP
jgi:Transposase IS66 family